MQAIELGSQASKLAEIKNKLIANKGTTSLFNSKLFIQNLEQALIQAHTLSETNQPPKDITVDIFAAKKPT